MGGSAHLNFTAGGLVAAGGAYGFAVSGSMPSLIGGAVAGGAFIGAGAIISNGQDFEGHALGAGSGWALAAGMGQRAFSTGKFMPAGAAAAIGLIAALYNSKKAKDWS